MEQAEKAGVPRMKELVGILKRADTAYYKHDDPIMTDREYDALFDELKMLEDNSGIVLSGSPDAKGLRRNTGRAYGGRAHPPHAVGGKDKVRR